MSRIFTDVATTDYIDTGIVRLLERDVSMLTGMSGSGTMTSSIANLVYTDLTAKKIYTIENGESVELINYNNGGFITQQLLSTSYQALSTVLTKFSNTSVTGQGVICDNTFVPMSNFFKTNINLSDATAVREGIGLGTLALKNAISINDIPDNTITSDKFQSALITTPQFYCGEVVYSYKSSEREGFIRLQDGATIGSALSGATYSGTEYSNLFAVLWANTNNKIYTSTGATTTRGTTAAVDFSNNCRVELPYKLNKFSEAPGTVHSWFGSGTYTLSVNTSGYYDIVCVGGGGATILGNNTFSGNSGNFGSCAAAAGGSGAYGSARFHLTGGQTMTIVCGAHGENQHLSYYEKARPSPVQGASGGASSVSVNGTTLINAGGGTGGYVSIPYYSACVYGTVTAGTGGTVTIDSSGTNVSSSNGNNGTASKAGWGTSISVTGGASVYNGYGAAGSGTCTPPSSYNFTSNGSGGYIQVTYVGPTTEQQKSLAVYNFLTGLSAYIKI